MSDIPEINPTESINEMSTHLMHLSIYLSIYQRILMIITHNASLHPENECDPPWILLWFGDKNSGFTFEWRMRIAVNTGLVAVAIAMIIADAKWVWKSLFNDLS